MFSLYQHCYIGFLLFLLNKNMPQNFEQKFESKNDPLDNKEIYNTEAENIKKNEGAETVEPTLNKPKTIDKSELERNDQQKLAEIRGTLKSEMEKNNGWEVIRRPREQWKQEHEITTDSPFDRFRGWLKSFSKTEREAKRINEELQKEFKEDRTKYPENGFDYKKGIGVEGMAGNKVGILAKGFGECSGLVFQTPDKVAVVHISPNVFRDAFEGGEIVRDKDVRGHIRSALKKLLSKEQKETAEKTINNTDLSKEEIAELQKMIDSGDLKSTMLSGEDSLVPHEIVTELGKLAKFNNLPFVKTEIHYVGAVGGGGGYAIYANPEDMYYLGSNGKVMKKGKNLPLVMYEYKEKK